MRKRADEYYFQIAVVNYLRISGYLVFAVPNGGSRNIIEAAKLKLAGAPDLVVIGKGGGIDFIELKTKSGALSTAQREFQRQCQMRCVNYYVFKSIKEVENYIKEGGADEIGGTD